MIKKFLAVLISFSLIYLFNTLVYAEETVDMKDWRFIQLISNDEYTISKYYLSSDTNQYAFCVEPDSKFDPNQTYYKDSYDDDYVFNIVKAYDQYGLILDKNADTKTGHFNYYIACQLLIWEHLTDDTYEFDKDFSFYKQDILDYIDNLNKPKLLMSTSTYETYESKVGEEITIEEDFTKYDVLAEEGIEIIDNSENGLTYKLTNEEPELKSIELNPKYNPKDYAYVYHCDNAQDIYSFEGIYETPKPLFLSLQALPSPKTYVDIYYSKKDLIGNPIDGAEFTVYEINPEDPDLELIFINTNIDIDLYQAILGDYSLYDDLSIEISERYDIYLNENIINTSEVGYFPYKIYNKGILIKEGRCYVSDDANQTNGSYNKIDVLSVFKGYSELNEINTISSLETNKQYYLCESEPKKGYIYTHNACKLVDTSDYDGEVHEFINDTRTYTLKLMKQSPYEVLLDGAKFKITYLDGYNYKTVILTTGYLTIDRVDNAKYLIYKHEGDLEPTIVEFNDDLFITNNVKTGKYYYYESDNQIINDCLLNNTYTYVVKGGFCIENMPYSSSITIEELVAPKGFMITDPIYHISPNIAYSEITFRNFRVNEFNILPKKKFKVPKTCIED